jgi:hypothetical protein
MPENHWLFEASTDFCAGVLEQVYGALTFYLANKSHIDSYLKKAQAEFEAMCEAAHEKDPMFYQKLADARRESDLTSS